MLQKHCAKCREIKSASDFYRDRSKRSGLGAYCKSCESKRVRDWKLANRQTNKMSWKSRWRRWYIKLPTMSDTEFRLIVLLCLLHLHRNAEVA